MPYSLPKVQTPTKALVVADLRDDRMDAQIAACVLQGIVNRDSEEKIYVHHTYCADNRGDWRVPRTASYRMAHVAEQWLREVYGDIPQTALAPAEDAECPAFLALLDRYARFVKGVIIFDPRMPDATIEMATTIAGQKDGLVVSPELHERIAGYGFPVIEDLRTYAFVSNVDCLHVLKEKYFKGANKAVAFTWSHMTLDEKSWGAANKDYVVANRLFTFYLDIFDEKERAHYADVILEYPMGTPILGWTDELVADQHFAKMGYVMIPYISVENLSVASSFPSVHLPQPEFPPVTLEEDAVYIAFHVADGDNLLHSLVYEPFTIRRDPHFGKVPATWVLNPIMAEIAPRAMAWHAKTLLSAGQEPAAMLGDGSPQSERYEGFGYYCGFARHYMDLAGMRTMKQMLEAEAVAWNVRPGAILGGYSGADYRGIGAYEYHLDGDTFHIGSRPLGECDVVSLIEHAPEGQPLFLSIFSGTGSLNVSTRILRYSIEWAEKLPNKKLVFVTATQAAQLYREWIGRQAQQKR